jgi:glycine cleavage system pyridoxal-binding protein P
MRMSLEGQQMSKFYEAMLLVGSLTKEQQDRFISEVKHQQRQSVINELNVGTIVKINHKKISPMDQFRITKINRKNVKCQKLNSSIIYTVTPSLLEVIK